MVSTVGTFHTEPPDGPYNVTPCAFFPRGFGSSAITNVVQSFLPVFASIATTCPRNEQHSYVATAPVVVSIDEKPAKTLPSATATPLLLLARGCSPALVFQRSFPVWASTA